MRCTHAAQPARPHARVTRVTTRCQNNSVEPRQERAQLDHPTKGAGPKPGDRVRIRSTVGPREYWQIADVHCSTFYQEASEDSFMGQLLRVDRVLALNTGMRLQVRKYGNFCCLVAEATPSEPPSTSIPPPTAPSTAPPRADSWLRQLLPTEMQVGYERTSQHSTLLGTVVLDSLGEHLPPKRVETYGNVRFQRRQRIAYISNLAVCAEARRGGVGRALLQCCEKLARAWGCSAIALHVDPCNEAAHALYKNNGYKDVMEEPWLLRFLEGRPNVRLVLMMRSLRSVPVEPSLEALLGEEGVLTVPCRR